MRILILGAGGVGGYFGGRLIEAGADVTFFVREARARKIAERGLEAKSPLGDFCVNARTVVDPLTLEKFDLVILTCKAYDLDSSLEQVEPAVGSNTAILPLLNGLVHFDLTPLPSGEIVGRGGAHQRDFGEGRGNTPSRRGQPDHLWLPWRDGR